MANGLFQVFVFFCSSHSIYGAKLPIADLIFFNLSANLYKCSLSIRLLESVESMMTICDQVTFRPKHSSHS